MYVGEGYGEEFFSVEVATDSGLHGFGGDGLGELGGGGVGVVEEVGTGSGFLGVGFFRGDLDLFVGGGGGLLRWWKRHFEACEGVTMKRGEAELEQSRAETRNSSRVLDLRKITGTLNARGLA